MQNIIPKYTCQNADGTKSLIYTSNKKIYERKRGSKEHKFVAKGNVSTFTHFRAFADNHFNNEN